MTAVIAAQVADREVTGYLVLYFSILAPKELLMKTGAPRCARISPEEREEEENGQAVANCDGSLWEQQLHIYF